VATLLYTTFTPHVVVVFVLLYIDFTIYTHMNLFKFFLLKKLILE
jgi:hypothetical protein